MIDQAFLDECPEIMAMVAPEYADRTIYFIKHPADMPRRNETAAYIHYTGHVFRQRLMDAGKWRGPSATIVFVEDQERGSLVGTLLHELGHWIQRILSGDYEIEESPSREVIEACEIEMTEYAAQPHSGSEDIPLWQVTSHDKDWHRIFLHLHARYYKKTGVLSSMHCGGEHYDLSTAMWYRWAIEDELDPMADKTFAEILATDPPERFTTLWSRDYCNFLYKSPFTSPTVKKAMAEQLKTLELK